MILFEQFVRIWMQLVLVILIFHGCNSEDMSDKHDLQSYRNKSVFSDSLAAEVLQKSIIRHGGMENWSSKKSISYYKKIESLDSVGLPHRTISQFHQYQIHPQFKAHISWEEEGDRHWIIHDGKEARKYKNGEELADPDSKNHAWNASFGSQYVISMPFKLTDPGVLISYEGIDTFLNQNPVDAVKVQYEKGAGSSGGLHTWWYYFDRVTSDLIANYLDHGNGYSFTTYGSYAEIDGIRIPEKRYSYQSDSEKRIGRATTIYTNENIRFNQNFEKELFLLK